MEGAVVSFDPHRVSSTVQKLAEGHPLCFSLLLIVATTLLSLLAAWTAGYTEGKRRRKLRERLLRFSPLAALSEGPVAPDGQSPTRW
jgi:hypothetical protein